MKENKTLTDLYNASPRHKFGDITLLIEQQGGKLRGKFVFHQIAADVASLEKIMQDQGVPACFGRPPEIVDSDVVSQVVWDESYKTLGDVIPKVEQDIQEYSKMVAQIGPNLMHCSNCSIFERCYRIADLNLRRKQAGVKFYGKWQL